MEAVQTKTSLFKLPGDFVVADFEMTIENAGQDEGNRLSERIRKMISDEFEKRNPFVAEFFELIVEEPEVWEGSRKSTVRLKLHKKKKQGKGIGGFLRKTFSTAILGLSLLGTDYNTVQKNIETIVHEVEEVVIKEGVMVFVQDYRSYPYVPPDPGAGASNPND